jgi:hypothetical protein
MVELTREEVIERQKQKSKEAFEEVLAEIEAEKVKPRRTMMRMRDLFGDIPSATPQQVAFGIAIERGEPETARRISQLSMPEFISLAPTPQLRVAEALSLNPFRVEQIMREGRPIGEQRVVPLTRPQEMVEPTANIPIESEPFRSPEPTTLRPLIVRPIQGRLKPGRRPVVTPRLRRFR